MQVHTTLGIGFVTKRRWLMADNYNLTIDCSDGKRTSRYRVKSSDIMNIITRNFRKLGYNVITFGETLRELEKGNHKVIITKEK